MTQKAFERVLVLLKEDRRRYIYRMILYPEAIRFFRIASDWSKEQALKKQDHWFNPMGYVVQDEVFSVNGEYGRIRIHRRYIRYIDIREHNYSHINHGI